MRFAVEYWLWVIPLLPVIWLLARVQDRRARERLDDMVGPQADRQVEFRNDRVRSWRRFLYLFGIFWLLLALARPQWGASEVTVTQRGSDIVIALDISNSMLAEDVVPNRMERAKSELVSFLDRLEESRVGLVFFAGAAFVQCPLTLDYGTSDIFLKMAGPDMMSEQGTAIGQALEVSRDLLAKGRTGNAGGSFQAILLVTDGEDLEGDWESEAEACKEEGIRLIAVGVGEETGGLIPTTDAQGRPAGFLKDDEDNVVMSRLDMASLDRMASIGGGSPFRIGVDGLAGDRLFAELKRLGRKDLEERRISAFQERFLVPLIPAIFCFALLLVVRPRRGAPDSDRRAGHGIATAAVALGLIMTLTDSAGAGLLPPGRGELSRGREKYLAGQFEEALDQFEAALVHAPEDPLISLAYGETLFQLERYEEAAREFARTPSLTDRTALIAEARFNHGTALLAAGDNEGAASQFREALKLDPDQEDALFNLEVALRRLRQQEQQEQENQDQDQDQDQEDQEKQDQDQQDQEQQDQDNQDQENQEQQQQDEQQNQQDQLEQDQQQQDQQQESQPQEQEESQEPQESPSVMEEPLTEEQAMQILKALDRDEEELKRSVQRRLRGGKSKSGKKW